MEKNLPIEDLLYEGESTTLDFKREQYAFSGATDYQKSKLLKDILAFANTWRRSDAYILIGVEEVKGGRGIPIGINSDLDDAHLQEFVNSKTQRPINFSYQAILFEGVKIGVIKIPVQTRPFYLQKDFDKLRKYAVYMRRGSSTCEAPPEEVSKMMRDDVAAVEVVPDVSFEFADKDDRKMLGVNLELNVSYLNIERSLIPEFSDGSNNPVRFNFLDQNRPRPQYYRELVEYYYQKLKAKSIGFAIKNSSDKSLMGVRVEIILDNTSGYFKLLRGYNFPKFPSKYEDRFPFLHNYSSMGIDSHDVSIEVKNFQDKYWVEVKFGKVQAKQEVFCDEYIYISADSNFSLNAEVKIYSDNMSEPISKDLTINCNVDKQQVDYNRVVEIHKEHILKEYPNVLKNSI